MTKTSDVDVYVPLCAIIMDGHRFLLGLRLILALFCAVMNGIDLGFNVYAVPLKETFNFTQTQAEVVASMSAVGFGLAFIEILLSSTFGYITTFVVTWITLPLTSGLFGLAAVHSQFVHAQPVWVYFIQLCMSVSNAVTLTMVRNVVVGILPKKFIGTIIGLFGSALCLGKVALSGLLEWIYHHDLAKFFFTISVVSGVILTSLYPLLYPTARELERQRRGESQEKRLLGKDSQENFQPDGESQNNSQQDGESQNNSQQDGDSQENSHPDKEDQENKQQEGGSQEKNCLLEHNKEDTPLGDILKCRYFHMTFWSSTVFASAAYTVLNNITSITNSIGMKDSFNIVTTMSVCIMFTRLVYGMLFDKVASRTLAFWLLFSMYFSFALGLMLGLWFLNLTTVYAIGVLCGIGIGPSSGLPVSILVLQYGRSRLNPMYVAFYFTMAAGQLVMQIMMGYLYDTNVTNGTTCQGTHCFYWSFLSLLCLTGLISVLQLTNYVITIHETCTEV